MDLPTKTDCNIIGVLYGDVLMMQMISIEHTYVNLKGVMWVLCTNDVGDFRWLPLHQNRGIKGRCGRVAGLLRFQIPCSRVELIVLS